jgi:hypothetical protein
MSAFGLAMCRVVEDASRKSTDSRMRFRKDCYSKDGLDLLKEGLHAKQRWHRFAVRQHFARPCILQLMRLQATLLSALLRWMIDLTVRSCTSYGFGERVGHEDLETIDNEVFPLHNYQIKKCIARA